MRRVILLLFTVICLPSYASRTVVTQSPYYVRPNYYPNYANSGYYSNRYLNNDMYNLEKYAFSRSYSGENRLQRLKRLEKEAFGAIQQGDFDTRYENVKAAILSRPQIRNDKTSIWKHIGNYFSGQLTGFTPPISNQYNPYNPYYGQNLNMYPNFSSSDFGSTNYNEYSGPFHNSGFRLNNYSTGSTSGIHIID